MSRFLALLIFMLQLPITTVFAAECSLPEYDALVVAGKRAVEERAWSKSVEVYSRMLADCRALIKEADLAKAYDALAEGQLLQENFSAAIDSARMCLAQAPDYNACMLTAAKASAGLGDRELALDYAKAAVAVEPYDDYSSAVGIYAREYLKYLEKR